MYKQTVQNAISMFIKDEYFEVRDILLFVAILDAILEFLDSDMNCHINSNFFSMSGISLTKSEVIMC